MTARKTSAASLFAALLVLVLCSVGVGSAESAVGPGPKPALTLTAPAPPPPPKASIVIDVDTGGIWSESGSHVNYSVASLFKMLTALVVHDRVKPTDQVPISPRAESMPATKINVKAGQMWSADALLHSMLLASANDAAVALAERAGGGTTAGYQRAFAAEARRLGLRDHPLLQDPAGLDDEFSVGGGNLISAADLAIVGRAFLQTPDLAAIVALPEYRFAGGDGKPHRVRNLNRFMKLYPDAIGIKTGLTKRSGFSVAEAARRYGHRILAVVIGSTGSYQLAGEMLDAAFLQIADHRQPTSFLPGSPPQPAAPASRAAGRPPGSASTTNHPVVTAPATHHGQTTPVIGATVIGLLVFAGAGWAVRRRGLRRAADEV